MTLVTESKHILRFGDLDWKGLPAPAGWRMIAQAAGASFGDSEPVEKELAHQLLDGSVRKRTGYSNRTATFDVFVCADNSIGLAAGSAALARACDSPSTLLWTPPDGLGAQTVFEVVTATATWIFLDTDESILRRRYRVTINCLPFGRSVESVNAELTTVVSTARQRLLSTMVEGSARCGGSLQVAHASNGLGKTLILSTRALAEGFRPNLMQYCTQSTTPSSGSISGEVKSFSDSESPVVFDLPAAMLTPGSYQLIGFLQTGELEGEVGGPGIVITASTRVGSTTLSSKVYEQGIKATEDGVFEYVDCGPLTLPTTDLPAGSSATVRLAITVARANDLKEGTPSDPYGSSFQEFFLIPLAEDTALNIFDCGGTGAAALASANSRLWLDSADLSTLVPSAWMGTEEDRSDAYHAASEAMRWMPLSLPPGELLLYVANSGGTGASVALGYTPAWLDLAAK